MIQTHHMHTMRLVVAETLATPGSFWPLNKVSLSKRGGGSRRIAIVYDDKLINREILRHPIFRQT